LKLDLNYCIEEWADLNKALTYNTVVEMANSDNTPSYYNAVYS